jgi:hypothetical protein
MDLRTGLDAFENRKFFILPGLELRTLIVLAVATRYMDSALDFM